MMVMIIVQIVIKMRTGSGKRTRTTKLTMHPFAADSIIMIMKRISRAPIYRTRWEYRALYNNTNDRQTHTHTHTHTHTYTHTHTHTHTHKHSVGRGDRHGCKKTV